MSAAGLAQDNSDSTALHQSTSSSLFKFYCSIWFIDIETGLLVVMVSGQYSVSLWRFCNLESGGVLQQELSRIVVVSAMESRQRFECCSVIKCLNVGLMASG